MRPAFFSSSLPPSMRVAAFMWAGLALLPALALAEVRLPKSFSSHMMLQRDKSARVWGWAAPGEKVTVRFAGQNLVANAGKDGDWLVELAPMKASAEPQDLVVTATNTITLTDVLVGDVWMVSGQSNAGFSLGGCDAPEDVQSADFPAIRFSGYFEHFAGSPQRDGGAGWTVMSPHTAAACSGIGFYFARRVHQETGVPIGILTCCVGGTEIETWMSPEAINDYPGNARVARASREKMAEWEKELAATRTAPDGNWPAYLPRKQPIGIDVALPWATTVRETLKGSGSPIDLTFDELEAWMQSARAALDTHGPIPPPPEFGPVGEWLLGTSLPADLKRIPLAPYPQPDRWGIGGHGWFRTQSLYNGMIHPLLPFSIKGMLWYQGENGSGTEYHERMRGMIETLREKKNDDFPVYIVQLPNYGKPNEEPSGGPDVGNFPMTRMEQFKCLELLPKTGLAIAIDAGDAEDLHPKNKFDVGERLALWALAKDYGKSLVFCGPLYRSMTIEGDRIRISFDSVGGGLVIARKRGRDPAVQDSDAKLAHFAIAGADRKWAWADAVIDGDTVTVSSPKVKEPVAVRYAFSTNPAGCNLYNKEGLPASPFRTDDW